MSGDSRKAVLIQTTNKKQRPQRTAGLTSGGRRISDTIGIKIIRIFLITAVLIFVSSILFAETNSTAIADAQKKAEAHWKKTMKYGISKQRIAVIKKIEKNKVTTSFALIEDALINDLKAEVRKQAAYTLQELEVKKQNLWLSSLQKETDNDVLKAVVFGVSELKIDGSGPHLYRLLTNSIDDKKKNFLSAATIRAIGEVKYKSVSGYILTLLTNIEYSEQIRSAAAVAIGNIGSSAELTILENIVKNPGEITGVRMYSAYAMGKSGDANVQKILYPIIEDENENLNIRLWAIGGLAFIKDSSVVDKMIEFAKVDNPRIRLEAIKVLGKIKDKRAEEILRYKALHDPEYAVIREAKNALQELGIDVDNLGKKKSESEKAKEKAETANTDNS